MHMKSNRQRRVATEFMYDDIPTQLRRACHKYLKNQNSALHDCTFHECASTTENFLCCSRHTDKLCRPSFTQLLQELSQPESDLLAWSEEDLSVHSQAAVLGAPLEVAKDLYTGLQNTYRV